MRWWQKTTVYQVYPRSFKDSNGDGIGDIQGIISKLDYIQDMGFETIWFSPFFKSPQQDCGYDISDYLSIAPEYGTMNDADSLIEEVHRRGMKIVLDMVMNHTSIEHPWFLESRSSRDNPRRDWYIWRDGKGRRPPTNWKAWVGNNGWQYDEKTGQWFFTNFLRFQPDLNYNNPDVKRAMFDVVRFWLDRGVDGYRLDIFNAIYKDEQFRDNPFLLRFFPAPDNPDGFFQKRLYTVNHPRTFELAKELRSAIDEYSPDRFLLGEVAGDDATVKKFLGKRMDGLNLIFLFETINYTLGAAFFRAILEKFERLYADPYLPTYVFSNHDQPRSITRVGNDPRKAALLALFQFTARGVPVTYYGEEIGMTCGDISFGQARDAIARQYRYVPKRLTSALGLFLNRDDSRTPMQWDGSVNAGFCGGSSTPWLPVNPDYASVNVQKELSDEDSLLACYRRLLHLRKECAPLSEGSLEILGVKDSNNVLAYVRKTGSEQAAVFLNFGEEGLVAPNDTGLGRLLFSTGKESTADGDTLRLGPYSGIVMGR